MKWLYKLFNAATPDEQKGIFLKNPKWEISPIRDMPAFLRALDNLIPEGSVLYFEGGSPDAEIRSYFDARKYPNPTKIALGTIWPRPLSYHVPFTAENTTELADIMEHHATPEGSVHFHVYKDDKFY